MKNLPTARGKLNGNDVTVLRDIGCTGAIVKRSLVEEDQLLNYKCSYISIDRTMKPVQVARVYIVSPIYTGYFEALCVEDPLCDVVIGNLPEVVNQKHDLLHNAKNGIRIGPNDG